MAIAKTVVFCLPGNSYSGKFLQCWSGLMSYCTASGIRPVISQQSSCNIYYVRNMCLGGDVLRGEEQKPFGGELDYDAIMWIDSDIVFEPSQFEQLLRHDVPVASGVYMMADGKHFATVEDWDEEHFAARGSFRFMKPEDLEGKEGLVEVAYTGMGFMLVKRGVYEAMKYPWFRPIEKRIGNAVDFTMEDVAFCLTAKELGTDVLVDPRVRVRHEKVLAL